MASATPRDVSAVKTTKYQAHSDGLSSDVLKCAMMAMSMPQTCAAPDEKACLLMSKQNTLIGLCGYSFCLRGTTGNILTCGLLTSAMRLWICF